MLGFRQKRLKDVTIAVPLDRLKKKTKILVIDDDPDAFPVKALDDEGYNISYWEEVREIKSLERGEYDIIILDIAGVAEGWGEGKDGLDILRILKSNNPAQIIVAFSAQKFSPEKVKFFELADDVWDKPIDTIKCKSSIDELLKTKFTVKHVWHEIADTLAANRVGQRDLDKIEHAIAQAIEQGQKPDVESVVRKLVKTGEVAQSILVAVGRLAAVAAMAKSIL